MKTLRCIVVDDEQIGREGIADYITEIEYLKLVGLCKDAMEASNLMNNVSVDLIFLDIQMPKITGLEFIKALKNPPLIIVCTAYPSYAIEGFNLNVLDYLVKPITQSRFLKAVNKAKAQFQLISTQQEEREDEFFFIKSESQFVKIFKKDILYVEAMENYITIQLKDRSYMSLLSLKKISHELQDANFFQTHRSYLVNLSQINKLEGNQIFIGDKIIPISRNIRKEVYDLVIKDKLIKR